MKTLLKVDREVGAAPHQAAVHQVAKAVHGIVMMAGNVSAIETLPGTATGDTNDPGQGPEKDLGARMTEVAARTGNEIGSELVHQDRAAVHPALVIRTAHRRKAPGMHLFLLNKLLQPYELILGLINVFLSAEHLERMKQLAAKYGSTSAAAAPTQRKAPTSSSVTEKDTMMLGGRRL